LKRRIGGRFSLLPGGLDDCVGKDNPVRVIEAFVDGLDLKKLGFKTVEPLDIGFGKRGTCRGQEARTP
jgi:hypothetical protein